MIEINLLNLRSTRTLLPELDFEPACRQAGPARLPPDNYRDRHPGMYLLLKLVRKTNYFDGIDKILI